MHTINITTIATLCILALSISFAFSFVSFSINNRVINEAYGADVRGVTTRDFGTNVSESRSVANITSFNVAFWSCTIPSPVTIRAQALQAIYCPVFALQSDNVLATQNVHPFAEVLSAFPTGNRFGDVLIYIKNDHPSQSFNWGGRPFDKITIMVIQAATPVYGCAAPCR